MVARGDLGSLAVAAPIKRGDHDVRTMVINPTRRLIITMVNVASF